MESNNYENTMISRKRSSSSKTQRLSKTLRFRMIENFILISFYSNVDESNGDFQYSINRLQSIIKSIETLMDSDQCIFRLSDGF
jgi:hypothetical protein